MSRAALLLAATLAAGGAACTSSPFNHPVTISTRSDALTVVERIGPVSVEACDTVVLIVPIASDPADSFDALLAKVKAAGGNAAVDVQVRATDVTMAFPFFTRTCVETKATAAKVAARPK